MISNNRVNYDTFIERFIAHYDLPGLFEYQKASGKYLIHKKILIRILREKFFLSFEEIAQIFKNDHSTIIHHYYDSLKIKGMERSIEDAWQLSRDTK